MHILGHFDRFGPPVGGGIISTATILYELARRGHTVQFVTNRPIAPSPTPVPIHEAPPPAVMRDLYTWADLVVPHMTATPVALEYARRFNVPVVYPVHDDGQLDFYGIGPDDAWLVVFNAQEHMKRTGWPGRQMVVHPPVFCAEHRTERTGDAITIASLSREKGGELFWELVRRLPERRFIGVQGGWGDQIVPDVIPSNVEIRGHQGTDLRAIFRQTRLLLLPSQRLGEGPRFWTENWGRVAIEAACSGIPTIANPAPGPLEALGSAGIFRGRNEPEAWVEAIRALDDPAVYQAHSDRVRLRAMELERIVHRQLDDLDAAIRELERETRPFTALEHEVVARSDAADGG